MPVVDETQILHVLPLVRLRRQALPQERDGEIRATRTVGERFAQEDRAEPVRNAEIRIERRREVEQRVQQRVRAGVLGWRETLLAEVLERPDPVEVGGQPGVAERGAP